MKAISYMLLSLLLFPLANAVDYSFDVSSNGETTAEISSVEQFTVEIPKDVTAPEITGGTFSVLDRTVEITPEERATLSYTSSHHTMKSEGVWQFDASVAAQTVLLSLPENVVVVQSIPRPIIIKDENIKLSWTNLSGDISVSYVVRRDQQADREINQDKDFGWYAIIIAVFIIVVGYYIIRKRKKTSDPDVTEDQLNVIRAANENEALVLKILLKNKGHMKRNKLEKESGLSKSSLASSLKNLEKKKIAEIDRSFHVHYIQLSEWFKGL